MVDTYFLSVSFLKPGPKVIIQNAVIFLRRELFPFCQISTTQAGNQSVILSCVRRKPTQQSHSHRQAKQRSLNDNFHQMMAFYCKNGRCVNTRKQPVATDRPLSETFRQHRLFHTSVPPRRAVCTLDLEIAIPSKEQFLLGKYDLASVSLPGHHQRPGLTSFPGQ